MLTVGDMFPEFALTANTSDNLQTGFTDMTHKTFADKWQIFFFWPKDFTFVCPTEMVAFGELDSEFKARNAQVIGASTDTEHVHLAWRQHDNSIKHLPFPMLADVKRELTQTLGIIDKEAGVAQRATFIVDPEGKIRFAMVNDLGVGRNPKEVLRMLDALQTGELCPCNWQKGDATLDV